MPTEPTPAAILVADSGSTKTDWLLLADGKEEHRLTTPGINPFMMTETEIRRLLDEQLQPRLPQPPATVYFYGAGCRDEGIDTVRRALQGAFGLPAASCHVASDLLGAARALCGDAPGIVCILGTGSNCCLYDGENIADRVPSLGYALGDEGSGAALGKRLLVDFLRGRLPEDLRAAFRQDYPALTEAEAVRRVYREPFPNRFLASFAEFYGRHREHPVVREMIRDAFTDFYRSGISRFADSGLAVSFVGSVAFFLRQEMEEFVASAFGVPTGRFLRSPIDGLGEYHRVAR